VAGLEGFEPANDKQMRCRPLGATTTECARKEPQTVCSSFYPVRVLILLQPADRDAAKLVIRHASSGYDADWHMPALLISRTSLKL
jgi:hypothetical protein